MKPLQLCPNCGKEFRPGLYKKSQRMCSRACVAPWKHSAAGLAERFWSKVDRAGGPDSCWEWLGAKGKGGYGHLSVGPKGTATTRGAHRVAYEMSNPPLGELLACHRCDNPSCVNPDHIFAGTNSDNVKDCVSKGRKPTGESMAAKRSLSVNDVNDIRRAADGGESHESIAKRYPVQRRQISRIAQGVRYKWVA